MLRSYHLFRQYLGKRVHVGVCGSIAAYKILDLVRALHKAGPDIGVTLTRSGAEFIPALNFRALGADPVYVPAGVDREDTFAHLAPGKTADCLLIAPATANTLARLAGGFADELLSCQVLAFSGPVILAPAMNPAMWNAPAVQENRTRLEKRGYVCIPPGNGDTACGDSGQGRLAEDHVIFSSTLRSLTNQDLLGLKVLVTCGPTREGFDPVRYWSNPSSGKMGFALAMAAWLRGAKVHLVHGPAIDPGMPSDMQCLPVTTATEMNEAVQDLWPEMDAGCFAAAVADFAPESAGDKKFKKGNRSGLTVHFTPTPDILARAGKNKQASQRLIGFAAETEGLEQSCAEKLEAKNLDIVVGNLVQRSDSGFAADNNRVTVLDRRGRKESWPSLAKTEVAWRIWDWLRDLE
ncbi:MAG: bifunctional phosphopantothenoylcysteine decarboxylase/phosphopantothenate--cysteine ligase CoaBC [Desulfonatronovibrionaceae bacterium]